MTDKGKCAFANDSGVLWCPNTWTKTRVICANPVHIEATRRGEIRGAASLYIRWNDSDELEVKSDVCCAAHCIDFKKSDSETN